MNEEKSKNYKSNFVFVSVGLLVLSTLHIMPYGFYQLTRLIVCGLSVYLSYMEYRISSGFNFWSILFALVAVLFNPIIKIYFPVHVWLFVDLAVAVFYVLYWFVNSKGSLAKS